jgi:hypothetical protein
MLETMAWHHMHRDGVLEQLHQQFLHQQQQQQQQSKQQHSNNSSSSASLHANSNQQQHSASFTLLTKRAHSLGLHTSSSSSSSLNGKRGSSSTTATTAGDDQQQQHQQQHRQTRSRHNSCSTPKTPHAAHNTSSSSANTGTPSRRHRMPSSSEPKPDRWSTVGDTPSCCSIDDDDSVLEHGLKALGCTAGVHSISEIAAVLLAEAAETSPQYVVTATSSSGDVAVTGLTYAGFMAWCSVHSGRTQLLRDLCFIACTACGMRPAKASQVH